MTTGLECMIDLTFLRLQPIIECEDRLQFAFFPKLREEFSKDGAAQHGQRPAYGYRHILVLIEQIKLEFLAIIDPDFWYAKSGVDPELRNRVTSDIDLN